MIEYEWQKRSKNPQGEEFAPFLKMRADNVMRIMPVSDSPWAPTGFGTNTKNISAIWSKAGYHVGYGGCQNPKHDTFHCPWPLGQEETWQSWEQLPIMHAGQEKYGEKSFPEWVRKFKPNLIFTHLDIQMFQHIAMAKKPQGVTLPFYDDKGNILNRKQRLDMLNKGFKTLKAGVGWKLGGIIPIDGQPCIPDWANLLMEFDYPVYMARYGQEVVEKEFPQLTNFKEKGVVIPHGVDSNFFKPKMIDRGHKAFVVGCVARNQHRKNIPRLIKGFADFVHKRGLKPDQIKLMLHMQWNDYMGWDIDDMTKRYGIREYMYENAIGNLDANAAPTEQEMVDNVYNHMDVFILPTAGEGFGIPTIEAMSCGVPAAVTNYTTAYEIIKMKDYSDRNEECPLMPLGDSAKNGRDHIDFEEDMTDRGFLLPYKDMWWDTPRRAAPQRAIASEVAISEVIEFYYDNPEIRLEHGKNARNHIKKTYDWDVIGQKWVDWIKMVESEMPKKGKKKK